MITLITGTPGQGKSVYAVWHEIRVAIDSGRPVYYNGIPKLTLPAVRLLDDEVRSWAAIQLPFHYEKYVDSSGQEHSVKIYEKQENVQFLEFQEENHPVLSNIEEGALIVIDESQRIFRPMGSGSAIPDYLAYLEYHRHHGIDFVLLTQHPKLVHVNVRALVGRHIHLRNGVLGRVSHEFGEWCENPQTKSARAGGLTRKNSLPKAAFALFESASIHVKQKKGVPIQFYLLGFIFLVLPVLGFYAYKSINKKITPSELIVEAKSNASKSVNTVNTVNTVQPVAVAFPVVPPLEYHASNQVDWTNVAGCISSKKQAACYDNNGIRVLLPADTVRAAILHGWPGRKVDVATQGGTTKGATETLQPVPSGDTSAPLITPLAAL